MTEYVQTICQSALDYDFTKLSLGTKDHGGISLLSEPKPGTSSEWTYNAFPTLCFESVSISGTLANSLPSTDTIFSSQPISSPITSMAPPGLEHPQMGQKPVNSSIELLFSDLKIDNTLSDDHTEDEKKLLSLLKGETVSKTKNSLLFSENNQNGQQSLSGFTILNSTQKASENSFGDIQTGQSSPEVIISETLESSNVMLESLAGDKIREVAQESLSDFSSTPIKEKMNEEGAATESKSQQKLSRRQRKKLEEEKKREESIKALQDISLLDRTRKLAGSTRREKKEKPEGLSETPVRAKDRSASQKLLAKNNISEHLESNSRTSKSEHRVKYASSKDKLQIEAKTVSEKKDDVEAIKGINLSSQFEGSKKNITILKRPQGGGKQFQVSEEIDLPIPSEISRFLKSSQTVQNLEENLENIQDSISEETSAKNDKSDDEKSSTTLLKNADRNKKSDMSVEKENKRSQRIESSVNDSTIVSTESCNSVEISELQSSVPSNRYSKKSSKRGAEHNSEDTIKKVFGQKKISTSKYIKEESSIKETARKVLFDSAGTKNAISAKSENDSFSLSDKSRTSKEKKFFEVLTHSADNEAWDKLKKYTKVYNSANFLQKTLSCLLSQNTETEKQKQNLRGSKDDFARIIQQIESNFLNKSMKSIGITREEFQEKFNESCSSSVLTNLFFKEGITTQHLDKWKKRAPDFWTNELPSSVKVILERRDPRIIKYFQFSETEVSDDNDPYEFDLLTRPKEQAKLLVDASHVKSELVEHLKLLEYRSLLLPK